MSILKSFKFSETLEKQDIVPFKSVFDNGEVCEKIDSLLLLKNKDVNSYLDYFRLSGKKYNLENKKDFEKIYDYIIRKVSYINVGDYEYKDYARVDNEGFYDIFENSLSFENYCFLYENYYKYDHSYIHELYFEKHGYLEKDPMGWDFAGSGEGGSKSKVLALPIHGKFSEIFQDKDFNNENLSKDFLKFVLGNLNLDFTDNFDIEFSNLLYLIQKLDFEKRDCNIIKFLINLGVNINKLKFEEYIYDKYFKSFDYLDMVYIDYNKGLSTESEEYSFDNYFGPDYYEKFSIKFDIFFENFLNYYKENNIQFSNHNLDKEINSGFFNLIIEKNKGFYENGTFRIVPEDLISNYSENDITIRIKNNYNNKFEYIDYFIKALKKSGFLFENIDKSISFLKKFDLDISKILEIKSNCQIENVEYNSGDYYVNEIINLTKGDNGIKLKDIDYKLNGDSINFPHLKLFPDYLQKELNDGYIYQGNGYMNDIKDLLINNVSEYFNKNLFTKISYDDKYTLDINHNFVSYYKSDEYYNAIENYKEFVGCISSGTEHYDDEKDILLFNDEKDIFKILKTNISLGKMISGIDSGINNLTFSHRKTYVSGFEKIFHSSTNFEFLKLRGERDIHDSEAKKHNYKIKKIKEFSLLLILGNKSNKQLHHINQRYGTQVYRQIRDGYADDSKIYLDLKGHRVEDIDNAIKLKDSLINMNLLSNQEFIDILSEINNLLDNNFELLDFWKTIVLSKEEGNLLYDKIKKFREGLSEEILLLSDKVFI